MPLPSACMLRCFYLNAFRSILHRIIGEFTLWYEVWVPVVKSIPHKGWTVPRDGYTHKLADDTAESRWHQECFEPGYLFLVKTGIDETEQFYELLHSLAYIVDGKPIRKHAFGVEI